MNLPRDWIHRGWLPCMGRTNGTERVRNCEMRSPVTLKPNQSHKTPFTSRPGVGNAEQKNTRNGASSRRGKKVKNTKLNFILCQHTPQAMRNTRKPFRTKFEQQDHVQAELVRGHVRVHVRNLVREHVRERMFVNIAGVSPNFDAYRRTNFSCKKI